jgi:indole-3-glycerol phosphate synthase/phosphoribosylanthranilate isomerase
MADVLAGIIERKRREVAARLRGRSFDARPTRRSLAEALAQPGARFIMEVKRASPSGHRSALPVADAVRAYAPVADAISVLTDGPGFGGSIDDLAEARRLFDGPILAKDFLVDPGQVAQARAAGADAVLAMLSVLTDDEAREVMAEAARLGMDVIVEVHDEKELERSLSLRPRIVGVNNRDLKTLMTNLSVTERLAPLIPAGVLAIAESGIATRKDVDRLASLVDAFLVGSALMSAPDTGQAARALVHGRVKLCGLTSRGDMALAAASGATHAGLIFVPGTPRAVEAAAGATLAAEAKAAGLRAVGVFRDLPMDEVARAAKDCHLDAVQLHGRESDEAIAGLRESLVAGTEIWAACPVNGAASAARSGADRSLFDNGSGGSGCAFDWSLIADREDLPKAFLAGGIGPANAKAASRVGAFGLDVGSGVELEPGRKDPAKVESLFAALRPVARAAPC